MSETARKRDTTPKPETEKETSGAERQEKAAGEKEPSERKESRLRKWLNELTNFGDEEKEKAKQGIVEIKEGKVGAEGEAKLTDAEKKETSELEAWLEKAAGRIIRKHVTGTINEQIRELREIDRKLNEVKPSEQVLELYGKLVKRGSVQNATTGKYSEVSEAEQKILRDFEGPLVNKEILSGMAKGELPWTINGVFLAIRELQSGFSPETGKDISAPVIDIATGKKVNRKLGTAAKVAGAAAAGAIGLAAINEYFGNKGEKTPETEPEEDDAEPKRPQDAIEIEERAAKLEAMRKELAKALESAQDLEKKLDYEAEHFKEEAERLEAFLPQPGDNDPQARVNKLWPLIREFSKLEHEMLDASEPGKALAPDEYFDKVFHPFLRTQLDGITAEQQRDELEKLLNGAIAEMRRRENSAHDRARGAQEAAIELKKQIEESERLAKEATERKTKLKDLESKLGEIGKYEMRVKTKIKEIKAANLESYRRAPDEKDDKARIQKLEKLLKRFSRNARAAEPEGELSMKNLGEDKYFENFVDEYRKLEDKDRLAFLEKHLIIAQGELAAAEEELRGIKESRDRMLGSLAELRAELPATEEETQELSKALFRDKTIDLLNSKKTRIVSSELLKKPEVIEALTDRVNDELSQGEFRAAELLAKRFKMPKESFGASDFANAAEMGIIKRLGQGDAVRIREMLDFPYFTDETLQSEEVQEAATKYIHAHNGEPLAEDLSRRVGILEAAEADVEDDEDTAVSPNPFDGEPTTDESTEEEEEEEEEEENKKTATGEQKDNNEDELPTGAERERMLAEAKAFLTGLPAPEGARSAEPPQQDTPPEPDEVGDYLEMTAAEKQAFMGDVQTLVHEKITYATNKEILDSLPQAANAEERREILGALGIAPDQLGAADDKTIEDAYQLFSSAVKARSRELATGDDIEHSPTDTGEREHDIGDADDLLPEPDEVRNEAVVDPKNLEKFEFRPEVKGIMDRAAKKILESYRFRHSMVEKAANGKNPADELEAEARFLEIGVDGLDTPDLDDIKETLTRNNFITEDDISKLNEQEILVLRDQIVRDVYHAVRTANEKARQIRKDNIASPTPNKQISPEEIAELRSAAMDSARYVISAEGQKLKTADARRLERRLAKIQELTTPDAMRANLERFDYLLPEQSARLSNDEISILHGELVAMTERALANALTAETPDDKEKSEGKEISPERIFQIVEQAINEDISKGKAAAEKAADIGAVRKIISTAFASIQDIKKTTGQGDAKAVNILIAEGFSFRPTLEKLPAGQPEKLLQEYQSGLEAILEAAREKEKEIIVADAKIKIAREAPSRLEGRELRNLEETLRVIKNSHKGRTITNLSDSEYATKDDLHRLSETQVLELRDALATVYEAAITKKETSKNEATENPEPAGSGETQEITREQAMAKLDSGVDEMKKAFDVFVEKGTLTQAMLEQNLSSLRQTKNVIGLLESSLPGSSYRQYAEALTAPDLESIQERADQAIQAAIKKAAERAVADVMGEKTTEKVKPKRITELNRRIQSEINPKPAIVIPKEVSPDVFAEIEKCVREYTAKKDPKKIDEIRTWLETK